MAKGGRSDGAAGSHPGGNAGSSNKGTHTTSGGGPNNRPQGTKGPTTERGLGKGGGGNGQ